MAFEIKRENQSRQVPVNSVDDNSPDTFTTTTSTSKNDIFMKNTNEEKKNLGMDFLMGEDPEEDLDEEDPEEESEEDLDPETDFTQGGEYTTPGGNCSYEEIQLEKAKYLSQLKRFDRKGISVRRFGMEHNLNDIKGEVYRIKKELNMDGGIDFCRHALMTCVSGIEFFDNKYRFGANLNGWSQAMYSSLESYDDVFEELYEKYYSSVAMSPEIKLILMIAGSACAYSLQKSFYTGGVPRRQREMSGPSIDAEDLIRDLNEEDDMFDNESVYSEVSNASSEIKIKETPVKNIPISSGKKRGRPRKNP